MRSIRLSLLVCILGLLVLSLGAISGLVSNTVEKNFRANTERMRELYGAKHRDSCELAREQIDKALWMNTKTLINTIRGKIKEKPFNLRGLLFLTTGLPPAPVGTQPALSGVTWCCQFANPRAYFRRGGSQRTPYYYIKSYDLHEQAWLSALRSGLHSRLGSVVWPTKGDDQTVEFWQLDLSDGQSFCGGDLAAPYFSVPPKIKDSPLTPPHFMTSHHIDNVPMPNGVQARRLVLKVGFYMPIQNDPTFWRRERGRGRGKRGPRWKSPPAFYLQVATTKLSHRIEDFDAKLELELSKLDKESKDTLSRLRTRLLVISLITFVLAICGGYLLVQFGLRPVGRLSRAVSEVSEQDIRLPLDSKKLPVELRPIAECLGETLDSLKRAFAREKQAAADISHELRTPLAAMLTTLDVALRKPRGAEEYRELLEDCRQCGQQMTQLVERMLALARLDSGADNLRPVEVDAANLAHQCAAIVRPLATARNVSLTTLADAPALIKADPDKLREVITNLLHNAIEYNKPDGLITLEVYEQDGILRIEVSDTGIGMSPETSQHIFERFYREDPSREANTLHAGIGLALVKGYVDLMDGTIEVESQAGVGSTFRIHLPVEANAEE